MLTKRTLAFLADLEPRLQKISPHSLASDRKVGGAMMRLNRDTRFSKDKRPYNPRLAARFIHESADKRAAPSSYLKVDHTVWWPGTGVWQLDTPFVKQIRDHIVAEPKAWKSAVSAKAYRSSSKLMAFLCDALGLPY